MFKGKLSRLINSRFVLSDDTFIFLMFSPLSHFISGEQGDIGDYGLDGDIGKHFFYVHNTHN